MWPWKSKGKTGPTTIPAFVGNRVVAEMQKLPHDSDHWVKYRGVMRPHAGDSSTAFDFRIFDEWETDQKSLKVQDYAFFDEHPEFIQYEGWFDKATKKVEMITRRAT